MDGSNDEDKIIVHADEIDEEGADITALSARMDADLTLEVEGRSQLNGDLSTCGSISDEIRSQGGQKARPTLERETFAPPPPKQPPPPAPMEEDDATTSTDSLSLAQLKNIVSSFQKMEPTVYAYSYADTRTYAEEIEEWFQYTQEERAMLRNARSTFGKLIQELLPSDTQIRWSACSSDNQSKIINRLSLQIREGKPQASLEALEALCYVALGVWMESAPVSIEVDAREEADFEPPNDIYRKFLGQIHGMRCSNLLLCERGIIPVIFAALQQACSEDHAQDLLVVSENAEDAVFWASTLSKRMHLILTILYAVTETGRWEVTTTKSQTIRDALASLNPGFLGFLCSQIGRIRWDDNYDMPLTRTILLLWKSLLLIVGSTKELEESKDVLSLPSNGGSGRPKNGFYTEPLDYHIFRQEIISKYPAYNPPPPLVPLEPENTSYLPTMTRIGRSSQANMKIAPAEFNKSIFDQPVHITTPVPSPPPSPAGPGGKGGKKQNYQTNQTFPFLYPPLDSSSNDLGGKGGVALQDRLVGKKWEGSDVPASILEAGELFASRMKMSRPLRQLWEAREACVRYDRGWEGGSFGAGSDDDPDLDVQDLKLVDESISKDAGPEKPAKPQYMLASSVPSSQKKETDNTVVQQRLDLLEKLYRDALPHLQSIIIVVLKVLLSNISTTSAQGGSNQGSPAKPRQPFGNRVPDVTLPKDNVNLAKQLTDTADGVHADKDDDIDEGIETLNTIRTREITSKAISGFLLMMLKWFRFSHVLKSEFLTQLLMDSNYLPLSLKYFATQDVDKAVDRKTDDENLGFFAFCQREAGVEPEQPKEEARTTLSESSDDEAQPPPIHRQKTPSPGSSPSTSPRSSPSPPRKPEVDELGYPTTNLPQQPLTTYSARFFFTTIAMLRILQKITKNHPHRNLLLVQYKSSAILRKALKVPQPALRLYTLKLFKSQVPYCGRKWRQANMRVITAIYVFCRMGLRDEWISGGSAVDEWVDNALAHEQAWRGMVGWWHSKVYRDAVRLDNMVQEDEDDFFVRELEKMGWTLQGFEEDEGSEEERNGNWEGSSMPVDGAGFC